MTAVYVIFIVVLLALAILIGVWFYLKRRKPAQTEAETGTVTAAGDEIGLLFQEAEKKLAAATVAKGARVGELPVYLLLGDAGSTKTSVLLHSGVEPELLAGQVYHERDILPTRTGNLWFGQNSVFVEAAGTLTAPLWTRLVKRLRPPSAALRSGAGAPRAALVFFDCENFTRAGAQEFAVTAARSLRAKLGELSEALGINLPVYVLFSKLDRLPFFLDYFRNLSNEESQQVFGATLPMSGAEAAGVYGEQQSARLSGEFERLFRSLADARPEFLARETDATKLPATYEFPREFRKIRLAAVQFLVDLCRRSQLTVGPFLRGFYFTGVRPVIVNEAAPVAAAPEQSAGAGYPSDATSIFRAGARPQAQPAAPQMVTRRVPQWLFLTHLFHDVLLKDRNALGASSASTRTSTARRLLLAAAVALCLFYAVALTISFFGNEALKSQVAEAAKGVAAAEPAGTGLPTLDQLRRLDALRTSLETLATYQREGVPWHDRWGLYIGDSLYAEARPVYFDHFRKLLLAQTQAQMAQFLDTLPATPGPEYGPTYDALKAYLITTSNPDKSTAAFLTPVLMKWWSAGRTVDADLNQLARKQFDYYADVLPVANPFSIQADGVAVEGARRYLARFAGTDRVYAFMLSEAGANNPPINFNKQFPGTAQVVLETHEVPGAFSKAGWKYMKNAIAHADRYFNGEQWVLGNASSGQIDRSRLEQDLNERYSADLLKEWRAYIQSASVVRYSGLKDASQKLMQLSGNQSPLLMLLSLASQNTAVDDPNVVAAFQPVQAVVAPGSTDRFIGPSNQNYMNALVTLQSSLEGLASQPGSPSDAAAAQTLANAAQAKVVTRQMAQAFRVDSAAHMDAAVQKLLEDPITYAEGLLRALGPAELNSKGKALCTSVRGVLSKYPFNPNANAEATAADLDGFFRKPDGALWSFYDQNLQKVLVSQGGRYVPAPAGGVTLSPAFVNFFNTAASFSDALYAGTPQAHFKFSLRPEAAEGIQNLSVQIDGQTLAYSGKPVSKEFTWQAGGPHSATATVKFGDGPELAWSDNQGLWAVFRFFGKAERRQPAGSAETLDWVIRIGKDPVKLPGGKPLTVRLTLDMEGGPAVFQPGYFGRMACPADIAR